MQDLHHTDALVSICIPVYNSEKTIGKTITSLLKQTYNNVEIIVVDNCSSDSTAQVVKAFGDPRLRIVLNDVHLPRSDYNWNRYSQNVRG